MSSHTIGRAAVVWILAGAVACRSQATPEISVDNQPPTAASQADSTSAVRQRIAQRLLAELGPRAALPAESVFTDIRILRGMPAGQLVRIMDGGFGRALGVTCSHCHEPDDWASDAKPAKRIARGMWAMDRIANQELRAIPDVSAQAVINCTTCHGGRVKPVSNLR